MPKIISSVFDLSGGLHRVHIRAKPDGTVEVWTNKTRNIVVLCQGQEARIDYRAMGNAQCPVQEELFIEGIVA